MSSNIGLDEVQARLSEIIALLGPDDEIVITADDQPVARLTAARPGRPRFGSCKGMLSIEAEDSAHLEDFVGYMA